MPHAVSDKTDAEVIVRMGVASIHMRLGKIKSYSNLSECRHVSIPLDEL